VLPGYSRPLVRVQDYLELVERCRYDGARVPLIPLGFRSRRRGPPRSRTPQTTRLRRFRCCNAARVRGRIGKVRRYIITIQAASFEDVENVELPAPPQPGEAIETNLGTCIVTSTESMPAESGYAGKIICRLP
jgi:hypothetical protein